MTSPERYLEVSKRCVLRQRKLKGQAEYSKCHWGKIESQKLDGCRMDSGQWANRRLTGVVHSSIPFFHSLRGFKNDKFIYWFGSTLARKAFGYDICTTRINIRKKQAKVSQENEVSQKDTKEKGVGSPKCPDGQQVGSRRIINGAKRLGTRLRCNACLC